MGCCQSLPEVVEPVVQRRKGGTPVVESCFPEKHGPGGYKVVITSSSSELDVSHGGTARGRAYARTVVGPSWVFACVFESLPVPGDSGDVRSRGVYCDAAAQYCADTAYEVFAQQLQQQQQPQPQQARRGQPQGPGASDMAALLGAALGALDRRFLNDPAVMPQDRLGSGCSGVLLHIDLEVAGAGAAGAEAEAVRSATVAAVGPCAAVLGQRQGGFVSATAAPLLLAGGTAASHAAVCELLDQLGAERSAELRRAQQQLQQAQAQAGAKAKKGKGPQQPPQPVLSAVVSAAPQEPRYAAQPEAPAALGFGACKGMGQLVGVPPSGLGPAAAAAAQSAGRPAPGAESGAAPGEGLPPPPPPPRVGLAVQTARHALQPADESLLLLGAGAVAALSPAEAVLLMHRFGQFAFIPTDHKPEPLGAPPAAAATHLPQGTAQSQTQAVQADSYGAAGPRPAAAPSAPGQPAGAGGGVAPFNAARLVSQQAAMAVGRRRAQRAAAASAAGASAAAVAGFPSCCAVLALSLDWPRAGAGHDPASPAGVVAGSPAALAAAAAAALREGRRGLYRWQQLRAYYKLASRRRAALIARWHELFDRVVGAAAAEAKAKEVAAWKRMGAALQVSTAGKVKVIEGKNGQQAQQQAAAIAAPAAAALAAAAAARGSPMRPAATSVNAGTAGQASPSPSPPPAAAATVDPKQQQPIVAPVAALDKAEAEAPVTAPAPPAAAPPPPESTAPPVSHSAIRLEERLRAQAPQPQRRAVAVAAEDAPEQDTVAPATTVSKTPVLAVAPAAAGVAAPAAAVAAAATSSPSPSPGAASPAAGGSAVPDVSPHVTPRGSAGGRGIPTPPATTPSRSSGGASAPSPAPLLGSMPRSGSSRLPAAPGTSSGGASTGGSRGAPPPRESPPGAAATRIASAAPSAPRGGAPPALSPPVVLEEGEGEAGADLMSPDADQLAMWAAEAAAALVPEPQQQAQAQAQPQAAGGALQGAAGSMGRAAGVPAGSRIPLSPSRADNISPRGPAGAKAAVSTALAGGVAASR